MFEDYNQFQDTYGEQMGYMPFGNWQENMQMPYWYSQNWGGPMNYGMGMTNNRQMMQQEDLESMYPDIYNIVYPMVRKACNQNTRPVTRELVDEMAQDIYSNIEADNIVNLNINVQNIGNETNRGTENSIKPQVENVSGENRGKEDRQVRRGPVFDLIKILLLRELIGRRPGGCRPGECGPRPPRPPRPWEPGRPPRPRY